jgi:hypothetical protein
MGAGLCQVGRASPGSTIGTEQKILESKPPQQFSAMMQSCKSGIVRLDLTLEIVADPHFRSRVQGHGKPEQGKHGKRNQSNENGYSFLFCDGFRGELASGGKWSLVFIHDCTLLGGMGDFDHSDIVIIVTKAKNFSVFYGL